MGGGADEESCCGASPMFTSGTAGGCDVGTAPGAPPVPWTAFSADSIAALLAACTTWRTCVYVCAPCTRPINARVSLLLAHCILFDRVSAGAETYFRVVDPTYRTKSAKWPIGNVMRSKPCTMLYASMPGRPRREKARAPDSGFSGGHRRQHRRCALARRAARTRFSNAVPGAQHRPPARSEAAVARSRRAVASIATCAREVEDAASHRATRRGSWQERASHQIIAPVHRLGGCGAAVTSADRAPAPPKETGPGMRGRGARDDRNDLGVCRVKRQRTRVRGKARVASLSHACGCSTHNPIGCGEAPLWRIECAVQGRKTYLCEGVRLQLLVAVVHDDLLVHEGELIEVCRLKVLQGGRKLRVGAARVAGVSVRVLLTALAPLAAHCLRTSC